MVPTMEINIEAVKTTLQTIMAILAAKETFYLWYSEKQSSEYSHDYYSGYYYWQ